MSILIAPGPYHLLAYGTMLGSNFLQSFVAGIIQFKTLPRPQFSQLQQATFPVFFAIQTVLPVAVALTYPSSQASLGGASSPGGSWGPMAVLAPENRWPVLVPTVTSFVTAALNWLYVGPETTRVMKLRKHQETRDGKRSYDKGPHSPEMEKLNRDFAFLHSASTIINLVGFVAQAWYGFTLGAKF